MVALFTTKGREKLQAKEKRWIVFLALRLGVILFSLISVALILRGRFSGDPINISMLTFAFLYSLINVCFYVLASYPIIPGVNVGVDLIALAAVACSSFFKLHATVWSSNLALGNGGVCRRTARDYSDGDSGSYNIDRYWDSPTQTFDGRSYHYYPEGQSEMKTIEAWKLIGFDNPEACESYFKRVFQNEQAACAFIVLTLACQLILFVWACRRTHTRRMDKKIRIIEAKQELWESRNKIGPQRIQATRTSENPSTARGNSEDRIAHVV